MTTTTIKLAVYGTLKSSHNNHNLLGSEARVVASNLLVPGFSLYECGWFPGAVRDEEGSGVYVELIEVPTSIINLIDGYEGFNIENPDASLFLREAVELENGETVLMYVLNRKPEEDKNFYQLIPSGKWENN
jgi:gamma-glutamylcyclotransferase (GGCT)/AIG2-like uncharacterized protein YtfP